MSTLTMCKQKFRGAPLNGESPLPSIAAASIMQNDIKTMLPENDPNFIGYGALKTLYPYTQQDRYNRNLADMEIDVVILENDSLKAVFLPTYGGRLWQLWDKEKKRDLLYTNDVLRPSNLGLRNAWFSGGTEWNCGVAGHHPFTCAAMFTAAYEADGMSVLRFYQWERIRNITYQIDFCMPDNSAFLYARTRIHNPNNETVPMYWWSNTAVPQQKDARVAVPAADAYMMDAGVLTYEPFPFRDGTDRSYPMNTKAQMDYFYALSKQSRKYEGYIFGDGTGLIQASTSLLQGRKLFVWGQRPGSETWQQFLTENAGPYVEIQAGIGHTQYGCVPMQPYGTWEFAEIYGPIKINRDEQKAGYPVFCAAVEKSLDEVLPAQQLEDWLEGTADTMGRKYAPAVFYGGGDAALENNLRTAAGRQTLNEHLDFGTIEEKHSDFEHLLTYKYMPSCDKDYIPGAFVSGQYWRQMLEAAANGADRDNWLTWYHLGLVLMSEASEGESQALPALRRAADLCANGPVLYALAEALALRGETKEAAACAVKSCRLFGGDLSVAKETMRLLVSLEESRLALALFDGLPENVQADERIQFWKAYALVYLGRFDEALAILLRPGYIITDFREGEASINKLWKEIIRRSGRTDIMMPEHLNFNAINDTD